MDGTLGRVPLRCPARTHAQHEDGRFIRVRCRDNKCPDAQLAKARGLRAFHVFDTDNYIPALGTYLNWPEFEPAERRHAQE